MALLIGGAIYFFRRWRATPKGRAIWDARTLKLPVFGSLPLAALPANLLAVPAAGPLMMWGMAAGVPAGLVGGRAGAALHLPTRLLMAWVEGVAHWAAHLPLPTL